MQCMLSHPGQHEEECESTMETLELFWRPIILSGVAVFLASSIAWMVLPHHRFDWSKLKDEGAFAKTLGQFDISPGRYMFMCFAPLEEGSDDPQSGKPSSGPRGKSKEGSSR